MMRSLIASAVFLLPLATPSFAQTTPIHAEAARMLAAVCVTAPELANEVNAQVMCQCAGEFTVRDADERLLILFTRVFAHYPDQAAARAELQRMLDNEGYTRADYLEVGQMLNSAVNVVDEQCGDATNAPAETSEN